MCCASHSRYETAWTEPVLLNMCGTVSQQSACWEASTWAFLSAEGKAGLRPAFKAWHH